MVIGPGHLFSSSLKRYHKLLIMYIVFCDVLYTCNRVYGNAGCPALKSLFGAFFSTHIKNDPIVEMLMSEVDEDDVTTW
jgi:hypothetical protein